MKAVLSPSEQKSCQFQTRFSIVEACLLKTRRNISSPCKTGNYTKRKTKHIIHGKKWSNNRILTSFQKNDVCEFVQAAKLCPIPHRFSDTTQALQEKVTKHSILGVLCRHDDALVQNASVRP